MDGNKTSLPNYLSAPDHNDGADGNNVLQFLLEEKKRLGENPYLNLLIEGIRKGTLDSELALDSYEKYMEREGQRFQSNDGAKTRLPYGGGVTQHSALINPYAGGNLSRSGRQSISQNPFSLSASPKKGTKQDIVTRDKSKEGARGTNLEEESSPTIIHSALFEDFDIPEYAKRGKNERHIPSEEMNERISIRTVVNLEETTSERERVSLEYDETRAAKLLRDRLDATRGVGSSDKTRLPGEFAPSPAPALVGKMEPSLGYSLDNERVTAASASSAFVMGAAPTDFDDLAAGTPGGDGFQEETFEDSSPNYNTQEDAPFSVEQLEEPIGEQFRTQADTELPFVESHFSANTSPIRQRGETGIAPGARENQPPSFVEMSEEYVPVRVPPHSNRFIGRKSNHRLAAPRVSQEIKAEKVQDEALDQGLRQDYVSRFASRASIVKLDGEELNDTTDNEVLYGEEDDTRVIGRSFKKSGVKSPFKSRVEDLAESNESTERLHFNSFNLEHLFDDEGGGEPTEFDDEQKPGSQPLTEGGGPSLKQKLVDHGALSPKVEGESKPAKRLDSPVQFFRRQNTPVEAPAWKVHSGIGNAFGVEEGAQGNIPFVPVSEVQRQPSVADEDSIEESYRAHEKEKESSKLGNKSKSDFLRAQSKSGMREKPPVVVPAPSVLKSPDAVGSLSSSASASSSIQSPSVAIAAPVASSSLQVDKPLQEGEGASSVSPLGKPEVQPSLLLGGVKGAKPTPVHVSSLGGGGEHALSTSEKLRQRLSLSHLPAAGRYTPPLPSTTGPSTTGGSKPPIPPPPSSSSYSGSSVFQSQSGGVALTTPIENEANGYIPAPRASVLEEGAAVYDPGFQQSSLGLLPAGNIPASSIPAVYKPSSASRHGENAGVDHMGSPLGENAPIPDPPTIPQQRVASSRLSPTAPNYGNQGFGAQAMGGGHFDRNFLGYNATPDGLCGPMLPADGFGAHGPMASSVAISSEKFVSEECIPEFIVPFTELSQRGISIDHRMAYALSQVDGFICVRDICDIVGIPVEEMLVALNELAVQNIVRKK